MPAITFSGVGSGIDTEALITGLVQASSGTLLTLQSRAADMNAAVTTLSDIGGLLASFKSAVEAIDTGTEVASYSATSSDDAVVASANGTATPGAYDVTVNKLAKEQRTYTDAFSSSTTALGQSGTLDIQVGSGTPVSIAVDASDTLESIVGKINASGERVSASIFYDGSNYRMQVRGLDTGAANALTFTETGTSLGLTTPANTVQAAQDAEVLIDGFTVTRDTNQIVGAIQGVTLALTETTTGPVTVAVESDPAALKDKIQDVVTAYNAVISKIHLTAGFGETKGFNPELAADSALRKITTDMNNVSFQTIGSGTYQTLASIGIELNQDGSLKLDETKLTSAVEDDAAAVSSLLGGADDSTDGLMDVFRDLADAFAVPEQGTLALRQESLESQVDDMNDRIEREQARLGRMEDQLRKTFTAMDSTVANNLAQVNYLLSVFGGSGG